MDKFQTILSYNCMNQEGFSGCIYYTGEDVPSLGIIRGEDLNSVISKIVSYMDSLDDSFQNAQKATSITSDDVKSNVPSSTIKGVSSRCALEIIEREFNYSIDTTTSGTNFTYDLSNVVLNLPRDYQHVSTRVIAYGNQTNSSSTLVADTKGVNGGFPVSNSAYPLTVDIVSRIKTECGDIDMTSTLSLTNTPGNYKKVLSVKDLTNVSSQDATVTDHITQLQGMVANLQADVDNMKSVKTSTGNSSDIVAAIQNQDAKLQDVSSKISDPSNLPVSYQDSNSSTQTRTVAQALSDANAQIANLKTQLQDLKTQNTSLQSKVDSIR